MEGDIKVLEDKLECVKKYNTYTYSWTEKDIEVIENLIARNKELENALKDEIQCFNRMKDISETIRKENVEYIIQNRQYELNYIPKSKVREKIEELEKFEVEHEMDFKAFYRIKDIKRIEIAVLQELLQEGDK